MVKREEKLNNKFLFGALMLLIGLGLFMRFWRISANEFLFYDEGMYLGYNRDFLNLVAANYPRTLEEFGVIIGVMAKQALGTAKAFWFWLLNLRVFVAGVEAWYVARIISAVSGVLTIGLMYVLAKRYFSQRASLLTVLVLIFLPSHLFYSRLGMQESLSTLLMVAAFLCYDKSLRLSGYHVLAGVLLALTFWCNYRLIISPVIFLTFEIYRWLLLKEKFQWQRLMLTTAVLMALVWVVGSLDNGINRYVTFGWMQEQAQDAQTKRDILNLITYPFNLFFLEGIIFGLVMLLGIWQAIKRQYVILWPLALSLSLMAVFTLAADQAARYIAVILPFLALQAGVLIDRVWEWHQAKKAVLLMGLLLINFLVIDVGLVSSPNGYNKAMQLILMQEPTPKIMATQAQVVGLLAQQPAQVVELPKTLEGMMELYQQGYRYVMLDQQAYITWANQDHRFDVNLLPWLEVMLSQPPLTEVTHINHSYLKRFVFDHNQQLAESLRFLSVHPRIPIRVYDLNEIIPIYMRLYATNP